VAAHGFRGRTLWPGIGSPTLTPHLPPPPPSPPTHLQIHRGRRPQRRVLGRARGHAVLGQRPAAGQVDHRRPVSGAAQIDRVLRHVPILPHEIRPGKPTPPQDAPPSCHLRLVSPRTSVYHWHHRALLRDQPPTISRPQPPPLDSDHSSSCAPSPRPPVHVPVAAHPRPFGRPGPVRPVCRRRRVRGRPAAVPGLVLSAGDAQRRQPVVLPALQNAPRRQQEAGGVEVTAGGNGNGSARGARSIPSGHDQPPTRLEPVGGGRQRSG
jgi:hypothetical protein